MNTKETDEKRRKLSALKESLFLEVEKLARAQDVFNAGIQEAKLGEKIQVDPSNMNTTNTPNCKNTAPLADDERSTRTHILQEVDSIINGDRARDYGKVEENFENIAQLWSAYLACRGVFINLNPLDTALMMDLVKTARIATNPLHRDSWIDKIGYSACGAGIVEEAISNTKDL